MKSVIIYLPNGKEAKYSESDSENNFAKVDLIETRANKNETVMTLLVQKGDMSQLFCGIPFNIIEKNDQPKDTKGN